jgi:hypothetical protein
MIMATDDIVRQFLEEECTPEQLLAALATVTRKLNIGERVSYAAQAYIINSQQYAHLPRPPKGEGLRAYAERFGVSVAELRRAVETLSE